MTLKELRERLAALKAEGRAKAASFDKLDAKADRTDDDDVRLATLGGEVDQITADIQDVQGQIEALEAKRDRDRLLAGGADPSPSQNGVISVSGVQAVAEPARYEPGVVSRPAAMGAGRVYSPDPEAMHGFKSAAEFAECVRMAVISGQVDERLHAAANSSDTHTTSGMNGEGYMVPPDIRREIWEVVFAEDALLSRFDPEPTGSNTVENGADETTPWGAAGVQAYWLDELEKLKSSMLATEGRAVKIHKMGCLVKASDELLGDAPLLNSRLTRKAGEAIRYKAVDAMVEGNGVRRPLGYRNSKAIIQVAKETGQAAGSVTATNILKMISRCILGPRTFFMAGQDLLPQLATMTIDTNLVYTPPTPEQFARGIGGFLNGVPLIYSQVAQKAGDAGDIQLINPAGYASYTKNGGIRFASSIHLYFDQAAQAFRWMFYLGGQPHLSAPISADKGKPSMSHFVELGARTT